MRRILLTLIVSLAAVGAVADTAVAADVQLAVDVSLSQPLIGLGEPVDLTLHIANVGDVPWITSEEALALYALWPHLEIARLLADGSEEAVRTNAPLPTPAPPSWWLVRDGVPVAAANAITLTPGDSIDLTLVNLVLYCPIAEPGPYRVSLATEFPAYDETVEDPAYPGWPLVALGEERRVAPTSTPSAFELALNEGVRRSDVEWFRRAREALFRSRTADEAASAFSPPDGAAAHVQASSLYWTGQAYELFGATDPALAAYTVIVAQYAETLFAPYASRRIAGIQETLEP